MIEKCVLDAFISFRIRKIAEIENASKFRVGNRMVSLFFSLSIKSVFAMLTLPRGSAHEIAFATQMHENRGRVPRFSYFQREKVSAWELSDVRVLQSQNTDCRKNEVFRQSQHRTLCTVLFHLQEKFCARTCGFTAKIYVKLPKNEEKSK